MSWAWSWRRAAARVPRNGGKLSGTTRLRRGSLGCFFLRRGGRVAATSSNNCSHSACRAVGSIGRCYARIVSRTSRRDCAKDNVSGGTVAVAADHNITPRIKL